MFDRIAPSYDLLNRILSISIDRYWRKKTIQSLHIEDNSLVLDIATGTGDLALGALRDTGSRVVGIDLSTGMLERAAQKAGQYLEKRYFLVKGDAVAQPFRDETFERAMVAFGIRNVLRVDRFLDELYRVLKEGGVVAVLELSVPSNLFFKKVYFIYFKYILPGIGSILSGSAHAYRYLRDSVMVFLPPERLAGLMEKSGFTVIDTHPFLGGVAHLYTLKKGR
jgi:demethylmenaquinone methyltransferase/2-methoxy-6-polyprenyl-1,4-benzoquinol methylase